MIAYPFDRRTGRDRRSGIDRRQSGNGMNGPSEREDTRESGEDPANHEEPRRELADVWNDKGQELFNRREYESAQHAFRKAIKIKPEFTIAWYNLSKAHCINGEKEEAIASLKKAVKLEPNFKEKVRTESLFKRLKGEKDFEKLIK